VLRGGGEQTAKERKLRRRLGGLKRTRESREESRWRRVARYRLGNEMRGDTRRKRRGGDVDYVVERGKLKSMCGRGVEIERREEGVGKMQ